MVKINTNKLNLFVGTLLAILLVAGTYFSVSAYKTSKNLEKQLISQKWNSSRANRLNVNNPQKLAGSTEIKPLSSTNKLKTVKKELPEKELDQLVDDVEDVVGTLKEMVNNYEERENTINQMIDSQEIASEQIKKDKKKYGKKFNDLLSSTQIYQTGNKEADEEALEERRKTLIKLFEDYPDSYMAARVAFSSLAQYAAKNDVDKVEIYYDTILDMQNTKSDSIVLNSGLEVVPNSAFTLAWTYLRAGQIQDSKEIVMSLEDYYPDSFYAVRSPGGLAIVKGQIALKKIRDAIETMEEMENEDTEY